MFIIVGYVLVVAAGFGGYALEHGAFRFLLQPIELMIIAGAAIGVFITGNSTKVLGATVRALPKLLQSSKYTKARYMALMALLFDILTKVRKEGMMAIKSAVDDPPTSPPLQTH